MIKSKTQNLLLYVTTLTALFIFFEFCFFLQWSHYYLGSFELIADKIHIPIKVIPGVLYFLFAQLLLHFCYIVTITLLSVLTSSFFKCHEKVTYTIALYLWVLGLFTTFLANQYFFPNSKFSILINVIISSSLGYYLLIGLSLFFAAIIAVAFLALKNFYKILLLLLVSIFLAFQYYPFTPYKNKFDKAANVHSISQKPNIIIIGIDSLRPDFLGYFGSANQTINLDQFLNSSKVYVNAFTPIARTYPSWVSILTGQYPIHHTIRTNLADTSQFNFQNTLSSILAHDGYQTIFATDETRFSNIDKKFGFAKVIAPKIGFNDFLLGTMNDFPFSNFLINTSLGKILFPYSYINRAVFTGYDPNSFIQVLAKEIAPSNKPIFLAVHFCLPHFPYFWGREAAHDQSITNYKAAIERVDYQFADFLQLLKNKNVLNNAYVFILSDHGEALELTGDRITDAELYAHPEKKIPQFYPAALTNEKVNQSAGHGTDVLGLTQYHVLLAEKFYPPQHSHYHFEKMTQPFINQSLVSLIDLKPTVLSILHIENKNVDGVSLYAAKKQRDRAIFLESDFSPQAIHSVHPEMRNVLFQGIHYFEINPKTTRLTVKKEMENLIYASKQFAILNKDWILAFYPQKNHLGKTILVNLDSGRWTDDLNDKLAQKAPLHEMLSKLTPLIHSVH